GVTAYAASHRVHEIGVRMALGASRGNVLGPVIRQGLGPALIGVLAGIVLALSLTRLLTGLLYGVGARDLETFIVVPVVLAAIAVLASYLPARRAAGVDPMRVLRSD